MELFLVAVAAAYLCVWIGFAIGMSEGCDHGREIAAWCILGLFWPIFMLIRFGGWVGGK